MYTLVARFPIHTVVASVDDIPQELEVEVIPDRYRNVCSVRLCQEVLGW